MGKVLQKLSAIPTVKSLTETDGKIQIVMVDGSETIVTTAHAARLFIQGSNSPAGASTPREPGSNDNATLVAVEAPLPPKYPGISPEDRKPIWEHPKGYQPNIAEGADAFKRGYARNSHRKGESAGAKEFEGAWDHAKRAAEQAK